MAVTLKKRQKKVMRRRVSRRKRFRLGTSRMASAVLVIGLSLTVYVNGRSGNTPSQFAPQEPTVTAALGGEVRRVEAGSIEAPPIKTQLPGENSTTEVQPADAQPTEVQTADIGLDDQVTRGWQEAALHKKKQKQQESAPPAEVLPSETASPEEQVRRDTLMNRLVAAYPDFLASHEANALTWRDGTRMSFDDGRKKDFEAQLANADVEDMFAIAYPAGPMLMDPELNFDPGRFRNEAFYNKMYGNCRRDEVQKKLVDVVWLPKHGGKTIKITSINGVAEKLQAVSNELDALPDQFMQYLQPTSGTYNCRVIAGTERTSAHGYGIAIDLNTKFSDYWQWQQAKPAAKPAKGARGKAAEPPKYTYRNRIPWEIAAIFEKHGFIWGAKWYHYDSMHFEYRPELLNGEESPVSADALVPMPDKQQRNLN
jgi:hypothetical protein